MRTLAVQSARTDNDMMHDVWYSAGGACRMACSALLTLGALGGCTPSAPPARAVAYVPRVREVTVTTVPLLVQEDRKVYPFLVRDFAKGGVLDGKEVYAFSPSTITVVAGDTIHFTFVNPEDDAHSFVLPDFAVPLPPQHITTAIYVARRAGIYPILCAVQSHLPMMSGQLVVLPAATMVDSAAAARAG